MGALMKAKRGKMGRAPRWCVLLPSPFFVSHSPGVAFWRRPMLKRNKYVGILSIAVTTLQYITIKYDYHI